MKKTLRVSIFIIVLLLLVTYVAVQFFLGSIIKATVNNAGPSITQSKVELADASISPLSGSGSLTGLSVGNPKGWSDGRALYLGKLHFEIKPTSIFGDTIVVNDLTVDQPEFSYETKIVASNIGDLMKNIEAAVGGSTQQPDQKSTKSKKYIVRHFRLKDAKVSIGLGSAAVPLTLPVLELTDLGVKEGGLTAAQLVFAVMKEVMSAIISGTKQATGTLGGTMGATAADAVKKAGEGIQKFFGGKKTDKAEPEKPRSP